MESPPLARTRDTLASAPVAVLGLGVSGRAAGGLLERMGLTWIGYDERTRPDQPFDARAADRHRHVVASPGFPASHPWLAAARAAGCTVWGEHELAASCWPGPLYAVTGSNGKTTLVEFLASALRAEGRPAHPVGNNGRPLSDLAATPEAVPEAIAVCEISSFQAESALRFSADALLWPNFCATHLDRYGEVSAYFRAKWNLLASLRAPRFYCGESVRAAAAAEGLAWPDYARVFPEESPPGLHPPPGAAYAHPAQRRNLPPLFAFWSDLGLSEEGLRAALERFPARPHRLGRVAETGGLTFWNDSKATNFTAVLGALEAFPAPVLWIGGGQDRGGDLAGFARSLAGRVRVALLIGETAPALAGRLAGGGVEARVCPGLEEAVEAAAEAARPGEAVVFSPGFSSFDQFSSYGERGARFNAAVFQLMNRKRQPSIPPRREPSP